MAHFERLSALDVSFLDIEDESTHMHVAAVLVFDARPVTGEDGELDIDRIRGVVGARIGAFPRYRQRLAHVPVTGHPVWVDDPDFNLQYHVRHTSLPRPGNDRILKRLVGRVMSQKLDRGKPLWEMWVVEGLDSGRFAVVTKVHHCMIDGMLGVELLTALLRPEPSHEVEPAASWQPRPHPTAAELLAGEIAWRVGEPLAMAQSVLAALREPAATLGAVVENVEAVGSVFAVGLRPTAETPLNPEHIGPHRRFDWLRLEIAELKKIGQRLGGTLNDVVLTIVAGALGRFLEARGVHELAGRELRALVPVNTRGQGERRFAGNRVAQLLVPLPVTEHDPVRRLREVVATTRRLKRSSMASGTELVEEISDWTSTALITQSVKLQARVRAFNVVVTNVPGPGVPLYLLDCPLLEIHPVVPLFSNQAVGIALFSYHGNLFWGINSDWDRMPDLHELVEGLAAAYQELRKAAEA